MEFKDRIVLITGGAKGIGKETSMAFHREGAILIIVDKDTIEGAKTASEIELLGGKAYFVYADVSLENDVVKIQQFVSKKFQGLDILINNAGIGHDGTVVEDNPNEWDHVISANLKSVYMCSHFLIPEIYRRGGGAIVNVGSTQSLVAKNRSAAYVASKFGVLGLTKAMAVDHAPDIRVNIVLPGSVDTSMFREGIKKNPESDKMRNFWASKSLVNRIADPKEIAEIIVFLSGSRSSFITGTAILADGGALAKI
jgi:NAD(P)-dependent dehydrogenase (short-subunit alcohol dehydrogenase family)